MEKIKSHFEIHARFRNGIFLLSLLLLIIVGVNYFYTKSIPSEQSFVELTTFQKQIDSLKRIAKSQNKKYRLKPFNPNFITDHKGYQLGLSTEELDRLFVYRNADQWINSISDFKRVTKISDSLLKVISPLLLFPEWIYNKTNKHRNKKKPSLSFVQKKDLNIVTGVELQKEVGIPGFVAKRIIKYRNKIGGFIDDIQLKDIYGLYDHQRKKTLSLFTVKTPKQVSRISVNNASVNDLVEVPYFSFETALRIRDYIGKNGKVSSFKELGKIDGFSLEKIDRIALYLTVN